MTVNQREMRAHKRANGPAAAVTSHVPSLCAAPKYTLSPLALGLPPGFERAEPPTLPEEPLGGLGPDEIRIRQLMIAAIRTWGWLAR